MSPFFRYTPERVVELNDRQKQILNLLNRHGEIQLKGLSKEFPEYSVMTLRRDLTYLEEKGYLIRTHGGAISRDKFRTEGEEDAYSMRARENREAKAVIAKKALPYVEKGRSVYLDAGSTIMQLARLLKDDSYTVITSAVNTALELVKKTRISVFLPGGNVNANTLSCSGPTSLDVLSQVNIDLAFMSASGFSVDRGFTVSNMNECALKKHVVQKAKKVFLLMDTGKFNKDLAFTFASLEDVDCFICEDPLLLDEDTRKAFSESRVIML